MIKFGEWLPDQPDFQNVGATEAKNVVASASGYTPVKELEAISGAADNRIRGIFPAKDASSNVKLFAGDAGKLYSFNAVTSALDDVSKAGGYTMAAKDYWRFVQFGNYIVAVGGLNVATQKFLLGTDSAFSDLSGAPQAKFVANVRDFVMTAHIDEGGTTTPFRVRWSAINDTTSWTTGTNQADSQDIADAGQITGLVGGEYATILLERAIVRATYVGTPLIFQFDKVEASRGCQYPGSVANVGHNVYYLSNDGFYVFDGQQSRPIGAEKVNRWFLDEFDSQNSDRLSCAVDPKQQVVMWSFVSNSATAVEPDKVLIYNYALDRWSYGEFETEFLAPYFTAGYTLEQLDNISTSIETLPASLDSELYKGGGYIFGGSKSKKLHSFTGSALAATVETAEFNLAPNKHGILNRVIPMTQGGSVTVQVGTRNRQTDDQSFGTAANLNTQGFCPVRAQGRFHTVRCNLSGNWKFAQGVDVDGKSLGER